MLLLNHLLIKHSLASLFLPLSLFSPSCFALSACFHRLLFDCTSGRPNQPRPGRKTLDTRCYWSWIQQGIAIWSFFFYNCKLFWLKSRGEHHDLDIFQFEIGEDDTGKFIQFVGHAHKTFKGGLKHRNVEHKNIKHYVTTDDSDRNPVRLYTSYIDLVGDKNWKSYKRTISGTLKFSKQNIGVNRLENLMKEMCCKAGVHGNFTNQSGKRTCATKLKKSGLDDQGTEV